MKKILILLFVLLFASPDFAAEWVQIAPKNYVDVSSIKVNPYNKNIISAWFKDLNPGSWDKNIWYQLTYIDFKCEEDVVSSHSYATYDLKGNMIKSDYWNDYDWQPVIPDSIGELKFNTICNPAKVAE